MCDWICLTRVNTPSEQVKERGFEVTDIKTKQTSFFTTICQISEQLNLSISEAIRLSGGKPVNQYRCKPIRCKRVY